MYILLFVRYQRTGYVLMVTVFFMIVKFCCILSVNFERFAFIFVSIVNQLNSYIKNCYLI